MVNRADLAAVEAFVRVAEAGSFRAAALALSSPASTLSVQVGRLERRLGARLFDRTTRRVALTDEGRRYFERVRGALAAVAEAEAEVASGGEARGLLRVAAPVEWGQAVFGRVLGRYASSFPGVSVEVELRGDFVDPVRDGFDVVVQAEPAPSASLVAKKLGAPMKYRLLASPAYLAERGTPERPRDLARHACVVMGARHAPGRWQLGARAAIVHRRPSANSWALCRDLALLGAGIAKLPDYLGAPALAAGTLVEVLAAYAPPPEQMFAVYARSALVPARLRGFVVALKELLDVWPGCLFRPPPAEASGPSRPSQPSRPSRPSRTPQRAANGRPSPLSERAS